MADIAHDIHIWKKMHFDGHHAIALTGFAPSTFDIEGEAFRTVTAHACLGQLGKKVTNRIKQSYIRSGVGVRSATDRRLINTNDFIQVLPARNFPKQIRDRTAPSE